MNTKVVAAVKTANPIQRAFRQESLFTRKDELVTVFLEQAALLGYDISVISPFSLKFAFLTILENIQQHEFSNDNHGNPFYSIYPDENGLCLEILGRGDQQLPSGLLRNKPFSHNNLPWRGIAHDSQRSANTFLGVGISKMFNDLYYSINDGEITVSWVKADRAHPLVKKSSYVNGNLIRIFFPLRKTCESPR